MILFKIFFKTKLFTPFDQFWQIVIKNLKFFLQFPIIKLIVYSSVSLSIFDNLSGFISGGGGFSSKLYIFSVNGSILLFYILVNLYSYEESKLIIKSIPDYYILFDSSYVGISSNS